MHNERLSSIRDYINLHNVVSFSALCKEFHVSNATMRRDLTDLEKRGLILRVHGGARSIEDMQRFEPPYAAKTSMNLDEKRRIAKHALSLIRERDCIILDSSTTVCELAKLLAGSDLNITVITNDMEIAYILAPHPIIELLVVGGHIRREFYTSIGMFAESMWDQLHADKLFFGVDAVNSKHGVMNYRIEELACKRLMLQCAEEHIVLCDHTKFSTSAVLQICPLTVVDELITGSELAPEIIREYSDVGLSITAV